MYRKSDNRFTRTIKEAKREAVYSQQFAPVNPIFITHYSGSVGNVPYAASGLNTFGRQPNKTTKTGFSGAPIGFNPATFGKFDIDFDTNTGIGMTALVSGQADVPTGHAYPVTRSMFIGVGGIRFIDSQEENAIKVSSDPVGSPSYWMAI